MAGIVSIVVLAGCASIGSHTAAKSPRAPGPSPTLIATHRVHRAVHPGPAPPLTAALTGWQLQTPISRAVVLEQGGALLLAGGLTGGGQTTAAIMRVNPADGNTRVLGSLPYPTHDAAGFLLHGHIAVIGGGSAQSIAAAQSFTSSGGRLTGQLPAPRSDLTGVTLGDRAYLVGGYDGLTLAPDVLATAGGRRFDLVARLPLPVRYPAVTALGGHIFVFGGQRGAGDTAAIQEVDPRAHRARVIGRLPVPLSHAGAVLFQGHIYVVGGRTNGAASGQIWSFDPASRRVRRAGLLPMPISDAGLAVVGRDLYVAGGEGSGGPTTAVMRLRIAHGGPVGIGAAEYPFNGRLLIADRGNNRLLLVDSGGRVLWTYPSAQRPAPPGGFYFPDDAFFAERGRSLVINEEGNQVVVRIAFPSGRLLWSYGHPGVFGNLDTYLHEPDDAYLLKNGEVVVADDVNCRILFINAAGKVTGQIGTTGVCFHRPPTSLGSPNGDTPLANGNVLVSEINGSWITEYTPAGRLVWTVHLPITYPSDPQQIGADRYLVADYATPGGLYEFSRSGQILWSYRVTAGAGMLDHPSLAERLPNGFIAVSDDYRHRVVIINPVTKSIVWQFGQTDNAGTGAGLLNSPDGFDLLAPGGTTPTHTATG